MYGASIVVGYDGSPGAQAALCWGVDAAVRHQSSVRLVYAVQRVRRVMPALVPSSRMAFADPLGVPTVRSRLPAEAVIAHGVEQARALCGGKVPVTGVVVDGPAAAVLAEQSERARFLVLGNRGLGALAGLVAGSVSAAVAAHGHCPVVVVREGQVPGSRGAPVFVAVDDGPAAQAALGFAVVEAAARAVSVVAVRVWNPSTPWQRGDWDDSSREAAERHALDSSLRGWPEHWPTVPIAGRLIAGDTGRTLAEVTEAAQLLVVGSRGLGGLGGLLSGSVSQYLLRHAGCPLAVVPIDSQADTTATGLAARWTS
jgi:nucleotide-binding universal stress UspA family protein